MAKQCRFIPFTSLLLLLILILSACGGQQPSGTQPTGGNGMIANLDAAGFGGGDNPQVNYNPFSPNALINGPSYLYEPLMVENTYSCQVQPWLATNYKWQDPETLIFTLRDGVKWSDGQPFGSDDVVFTMNMMQKYPALDTNGIMSSLSTITKLGTNQVVLKFKVPSVPIFERILNQAIVSKHTWEKVSNPVTFTDPTPVVTGPFTVQSFNQEELVLQRNPNYWQADNVKVEHITFHKTPPNQVEELKLAQGAYDWNAMFVPSVQQTYVDRDPKHNHYWFPAGGEISLGMNLTKAPFNDVAFRHAMAYAINRQEISQKAEFSYVQPASQTGLSVPGQANFIPSDIPNMGIFPFDQQKALDILTQAGYTKNASGKIQGKDGKPIKITFLVQNGWTDWIQASQVIQSNLNALGFTVDVQTPAPDIIESRRKAADYDMLFSVHGGSCNMYENYNYLNSRVDPSVNYIHFKNPAVDKLLDDLQQALTSDQQKTAVAQLAEYSYQNFPDVPLWYGANWFEFSTKRAVGWPDATNPYAKPGDSLLIITHLRQSPG